MHFKRPCVRLRAERLQGRQHSRRLTAQWVHDKNQAATAHARVFPMCLTYR